MIQTENGESRASLVLDSKSGHGNVTRVQDVDCTLVTTRIRQGIEPFSEAFRMLPVIGLAGFQSAAAFEDQAQF